MPLSSNIDLKISRIQPSFSFKATLYNFLFDKLCFDILTILEKDLFKIRVQSYWIDIVFFSFCAFPAALLQRIFSMGLISWSSWWFYFVLDNPYNIYWNLCYLWKFRLRFHYTRSILTRTKRHIGQVFYFH